ncbi:MAG: hypothetical protein M0Q92_03040 [Methanoregula sp.]|jgi:hypothetical protein|nr:hypothetical protein [Methanoregula sp.]
MAKRFRLSTRGFGGEPGIPDLTVLAAWITDHKGRTADIVTYRLDRSLAPQIEAGIMAPCAGGRFYEERILSAICGVDDRIATGELHAETHDIIEDAAGIVVQKRGAWCAIPAPHALGIRDNYYDDEAEWNDAINGVYRTILREMRDIGVDGHVMICDRIDDAELIALAHPKVFFFEPAPDRERLALLLERQPQVAVPKNQLRTLMSLTDEYTIRKLFIIDPDPQAIALARTHLDPDQIVAGGYNTGDGETYWKDIVAAAECER